MKGATADPWINMINAPKVKLTSSEAADVVVRERVLEISAHNPITRFFIPADFAMNPCRMRA
jgi:hypothetical protein